MKWTAAIIAGWAGLLILSGIQASLPAKWWFDAGPVFVEDTTAENGCALMSFEREINREFYAQWVVTIMRKQLSGGYATFLTYPGANDYRPDNELPEELDLCWWAWEEALPLPHGTYRVHTLWKLQVNGGVRQIRRTSNAFRVQ